MIIGGYTEKIYRTDHWPSWLYNTRRCFFWDTSLRIFFRWFIMVDASLRSSWHCWDDSAYYNEVDAKIRRR